jgi:hypothetical protein
MYFQQFPTIMYSNVVVTDVTRRVVMPPSVLRQPMAFAPYTVEGGQREDLVSFLYYGQDDDDWLISMANQIVDPYYGWYMDDDVFNSFIEQKYGSIPNAQQKLVYWATNWATDYSDISPAYYQALTPNLQKYWIPVYGNGPNAPVQSYQRRQEDWFQSTNLLADLTFSANVSYQCGDLASVYDLGGNFQGTAEVTWVSGSTVTIKDVMGTWTPGWTMTTPNGNAAFQTFTVSQQVIPLDEIVYFTPVTCYDMEYDQNEKNKEVVLVQDSFRGVMYTELTNSLNSAAP